MTLNVEAKNHYTFLGPESHRHLLFDSSEGEKSTFGLQACVPSEALEENWFL